MGKSKQSVMPKKHSTESIDSTHKPKKIGRKRGICMQKSTRLSLITTTVFSMLLLVLIPVYWFTGAIASMAGPIDDIFIVYILAPFILIHGFIVTRFGFRNAVISTLIFFLAVAIVCIARHLEISHRIGYSDWLARRSLLALAWSIPWFLAPLAVGSLRKRKANN